MRPSVRVYWPEPVRDDSTLAAFPFRAMESLPCTDPFWVGVKLTVTVQLKPGARDLPQLLVAV